MTGNIESVKLRTNMFSKIMCNQSFFLVICYWYNPCQATRRELDYDGKIKRLEKDYTEVR